MKNIILGFLAIICICSFTACGKDNKDNNEQQNTQTEQTSTTDIAQSKLIYKEISVNTAILPFRDYPDIAKDYAKESLKKSVALSYGDDIKDVKVTDINVSFDDINPEDKSSYTNELDVLEDTPSNDVNDKIYFEATFDILLSETADPNYYVTSGHYDESTNWVSNIKAIGDLVYDGASLNMEHFDIIS